MMQLSIRNAILFSIICTIFTFCSSPVNNNQKENLDIRTKIEAELTSNEAKDNQPRTLSTKLIRQISIFAKTCELEKIMIDGVATKELYSIERGKLILTLLAYKLAPSTYQEIFELVSFQSSFLTNANLQNTNLNRIQLSRSYLVGTDFSNANLEGANLYKTDLSKTNLSAVNLTIVNLREAILNDADLTNTILDNAYLIDAKINDVNFNELNSEEKLMSAKLKNI